MHQIKYRFNSPKKYRGFNIVRLKNYGLNYKILKLENSKRQLTQNFILENVVKFMVVTNEEHFECSKPKLRIHYSEI